MDAHRAQATVDGKSAGLRAPSSREKSGMKASERTIFKVLDLCDG